MKNQWGGGKKKLQFFKLILSILFLNNTYSADTTKKTGIDLNNIRIENGCKNEYLGITLQQIRIKYDNEEFKIKTIFDQPKSNKFGVNKNSRDGQWELNLPIAIYYNVATHPDKEQTLNNVKNRLSDIIKDEVLDFKKLIDKFHDSTLLVYFRYDKNHSDVYNIKNNTYYSDQQYHNHWTNMYIDWKLYENDERIKKESIPAYDPKAHFYKPNRIHVILWDPNPEDKSKNDISNLSFAIQCHEYNGIKLQRIKVTDKNNKTFKIRTKFNQISKTKCSGPNYVRNGQWNLDLPIELFYNEATHPDKEQTLNDVKNRLSDIIKDEVLDFNKLKANFPDSNLLIQCDNEYADIYDIRTNKYRYSLEKIDIDYTISNVYIDQYLYKNIIDPTEHMPKEYQKYHFTNPQAIHIILLDEKNGAVDKKNKPYKNITKDEIMNKGEEGDKSNKSNDSEIQTKTKDKNNKKSEKPSIQTPNGTTKSNQCCKCCGCCPCCKQKT